MARKSRKSNNKVQTPNLEPSLIQVAAYVRLSSEDRTQKGNSIENQQRIISNFIENHPEFELYDTYIDSGVSGTTFERPGFKRMQCDAESGKIGCIMVKDLSRLGRNVIDTGYYVEKFFPSLGVRIISITDNYDTDNDTNSSSITMPLINLVNEVYALDIGRKIRSQAQQAMKDGVYVGGQPPYGYMRSPNDRRKMIVDASAAEIIRQIFAWAADNVSIHEIARRLNTVKISPPRGQVVKTSVSENANSLSSGRWHPRTVERLLKNRIYLGELVQGKTKTVDFNRQATPADEWVCIYGVHEAIISAELFQAAQPVEKEVNRDSSRKLRSPYSPNIFKGKIYCAHCGGYLERKKNYNNYIYRCVANQIELGACDGNHINEDAVRQAVLEQLIQYREMLVTNLNMPSVESDVLPELRFIEMELSRLQDITRGLYENLVKDILDEKEYKELKSHYQGSVDTFLKRADELKQKLKDEKRSKVALRESLRILSELAGAVELTSDHIGQFVDRIEVFRDGRVYVGF